MARVQTYRHPELGEALRHLRARRGVSQAQLATSLGVTAVWLSQIETGRAAPSVALLARLLGALGSSSDELERLLTERPWRTVGEGAEWSAPAPVAITLAGELAELGALYAGLPRAAQQALLADARRRTEELRENLVSEP